MELAAAAAVGAAATAAYLDARFFIRKDLRLIRGTAATRRLVTRAARQDRLSPYYFLEQRAAWWRAQDPSQEAVWSRAVTYTWPAALERMHRWANWFAAQGVRRGDLVALCMLNSADFLFAWAGLWAIGAAPAMINYHLAGRALVHCLGISGARLCLLDGDEAAYARVNDAMGSAPQELCDIIRFVRLADVRGEVEAAPATRPGDELRRGVKLSDPVALFYTSGTTGLPKACPLPVAAAFGYGCSRETGLSLVESDDERYFVCMPFYHGTGGISAMSQLMQGTTLCLAPRFSVSTFWRDVCNARATWFAYVGETLRYLLAAPPSPLDRAHRVHSVYGNGLRPDVWHRFRERFGIVQIFEFFNSTEGMLALNNRSRNDFTALAVGHHGLLQRWEYHNSYVPVAVDTETGDIVRNPKTGFARRMPYEVGGEILIPAVGFARQFPGYWKNPEATSKKFVHDVFRKGDVYYRTGDALRRDKEGRWFFLDRLGDTFRWKGENVSTTEVSEVLGKYPGILDANVYGVELPSHDGKAGAAAIHIDPALQDSFDHEALLRHARSQLPRYAVPIFLRHVSNPSTTHNNKQTKVPLKQEGVHPDKIRGGDKIFWIEKLGRGVTYIPFTRQDWDDLHVGKAKL